MSISLNQVTLKWFVASVFALLVIIILAAVGLTPKPQVPLPTTPAQNQTTPSLKFGLAGYFPASFPQSSAEQVVSFWQEANKYSSQLGIHLDWQDTDFLEVASQEYDHNIVLVLGVQRASDWLQSAQAVQNKILAILAKNPKVKYLGLGNEVNLLAEKYPAEFPQFLEAYRLWYWETKQQYPAVKIFTTFQYESWRGEAKLMGGVETRDASWEILSALSGYYDAVGITLYPYLDFSTPAEIPANYFDELMQLTNKPIVVTETGWISQSHFGGNLANLASQGLAGSEAEQVEFLGYLNDLPADRFELINWLGLHDFKDWRNVPVSAAETMVASVGLKLNSGETKTVWQDWQRLFE